MARKIILIRGIDNLPAGEVGFRYAFWADVPAARQIRYANPTATSEVADASQAELTAIQTGAIIERADESRWPAGTTIQQVQNFLITRFNAFQAQITAANPWQRTGTAWDGTTWDVKNNG